MHDGSALPYGELRTLVLLSVLMSVLLLSLDTTLMFQEGQGENSDSLYHYFLLYAACISSTVVYITSNMMGTCIARKNFTRSISLSLIPICTVPVIICLIALF